MVAEISFSLGFNSKGSLMFKFFNGGGEKPDVPFNDTFSIPSSFPNLFMIHQLVPLKREREKNGTNLASKSQKKRVLRQNLL